MSWLTVLAVLVLYLIAGAAVSLMLRWRLSLRHPENERWHYEPLPSEEVEPISGTSSEKTSSQETTYTSPTLSSVSSERECAHALRFIAKFGCRFHGNPLRTRETALGPSV